MAFVEQEDILSMFEGMVKHIFKEVKGIDYTEKLERMTWDDAMWNYGNDKPDTRFDMKLQNYKSKGKVHFEGVGKTEFKVFNDAETVIGVSIPGASEYSRKQTDELIDWVKRPQIGMGGLAFVKVNNDGSHKSSFDKFFNEDQLKELARFSNAKPGDLLLIVAGPEERTRKAASELRLYVHGRETWSTKT
jgi:aspartyl-tRNA synthetase